MPEKLSNQNSLREKLPSNYIQKCLEDLKRRKKKPYDRSYISAIANEKDGFENKDIMDSLLRIAKKHVEGRNLQVKMLKQVKHMRVVRLKFHDRNERK